MRPSGRGKVRGWGASEWGSPGGADCELRTPAARPDQVLVPLPGLEFLHEFPVLIFISKRLEVGVDLEMRDFLPAGLDRLLQPCQGVGLLPEEGMGTSDVV